MIVVERVLDTLHEAGDHVNSLLVARRANEDTAVESPKQSDVDIICTRRHQSRTVVFGRFADLVEGPTRGTQEAALW